MKLRYLERHHHFRLPLIEPDDYEARLEANVVDLLLNSPIADDKRDSSIAWELKHQAGVTQMGRLLAARRGLDADIAAIGALLHDIYVIRTGSYEDHAKRGGPIAEAMMDDAGLRDRRMIEKILLMVTNHSDKDIYDDDPYSELGKDVDTLDCLLYPDAISEYLLTKRWLKVREYLNRAQRIWKELSLAVPPAFTILDDYQDDDWFQPSLTVSSEEARKLEDECATGVLPYPILLVRNENGIFASTTLLGATWLSSHVTKGPASNVPKDTREQVVLWPHLQRQQHVPEWMTVSIGGSH